MAEAPVESVRRAMHLLHELNRQRVSSVRHLHGATGLPKPTIVRLLDTLIALGYVVNDRRQGGYQVTSLVRSLSAGFHGDPHPDAQDQAQEKRVDRGKSGRHG